MSDTKNGNRPHDRLSAGVDATIAVCNSASECCHLIGCAFELRNLVEHDIDFVVNGTSAQF